MSIGGSRAPANRSPTFPDELPTLALEHAGGLSVPRIWQCLDEVWSSAASSAPAIFVRAFRPARPVAHPASGCSTARHRRLRARLNTLQATRCRTRRSRPRQARPSTLRATRRRRVPPGLRNKPHLKRTGSAPGTVSGRFLSARCLKFPNRHVSRSLTHRSSHLLPWL